MKRFASIILPIFLLMIVLCSCKEQAEAPPQETALETVSTTLMVYMIGSDLESKTAAGTADLEEIAASDVDLNTANILVYAGGTPYWHNELMQEDTNSILELTESGFQIAHCEPAVSMGDASTLSGFLSYCYENYTSDRYALILWNHGSGPVRGYGYDIAFDGGNLLLAEMQEAMEASPFGPDNPLAFVGFDACLMASAELACIWDDYAKYIVSSQEVEPSIGWNYQFISHISLADTATMLTAMTSDYIASCQNYYSEKGFDNKDTTLSCMDLSYAAQLEQSIDNLFSRAAKDVALKYNELTVSRVQTRSFGRATTGSEYDLVDLGSLTEQMSALYPEEAAQLQAVLDKMVLSSASNAPSCSGLSLYYPFYNKDYFFRSIRGSDSWQTTYQKLGLFPDYQKYLEGYQQIWNRSDFMESAATILQPADENGTYTLQLTEQQQATYAQAKYYILRRVGSELYTCPFSSSNVTNNNGKLTANFDGNVIYVRDKFGNSTIPVVEERDRIGTTQYYSVYVGLDNTIPTAGLGNNIYIGDESRFESYRYHLSVDSVSKELSVNALLPHDEDATDLGAGKLENADTSQWASALFWDQAHRYLTRDENGLILPLHQWAENTWFTGMNLYFEDEIQFTYEPLDGGEYYLMIEVQDTQGSQYCSELLPITVPQKTAKAIEYPEKTVQWASGDRVLLREGNGVEVYMNKLEQLGKVKFTLEVVNHNDYSVSLFSDDFICNDSIYCAGYGSIFAQPGQTAWFSSLYTLGTAEAFGLLKHINKLSMNIYVRDGLTGAMLLEPEITHIELSDKLQTDISSKLTLNNTCAHPAFGARAEQQLLVENDNVRVTLLGIGTSKTDSVYDSEIVLYAENLSNEPLRIGIGGLAANQRFISFGSSEVVPAKTSMCITSRISKSTIEELHITEIESLSLLIRITNGHYVFIGFSETFWCPVTLVEQGKVNEDFPEAEQVIYNKRDIRIALGKPEITDTGITWPLTLYNGLPYGISIDFVNASVNGKPLHDTYLYADGKAGPLQFGADEVRLSYDDEEIREISFQVRVLDIFEESMFYTDDETITLQISAP